MPAPAETSPLAGVRVIAIEQFGAGPWCTLNLAALGATVIKIEDPAVGGDVGRYVGPFQHEENSLYFESFNRGKKSVSLDMRHPDGVAILHSLVGGCDVVFNNLRGDLPARLGLTYDSLSQFNPRIVCCALSGFGTNGPRAGQGAYDYVIQGRAGWMSRTGDPDGPPTRAGLSLVDYSGGFAAAIAILAGLRRASTTGLGCDCDLSLFEVALSLNTYEATWALSQDWTPRRLPQSAHPSVVPFQILATKDGWIVICCPKDSMFQRLCAVLDLAWMVEDERFASLAARERNRKDCIEMLSARLQTATTADWISALERAGVPCGPVNDLGAAFGDPQVSARGAVEEYEHEDLGTVRAAASPIRVGKGTISPARAPYRGEHTRTVLREMGGFSDEAIDGFIAVGALGDYDDRRSAAGVLT